MEFKNKYRYFFNIVNDLEAKNEYNTNFSCEKLIKWRKTYTFVHEIEKLVIDCMFRLLSKHEIRTLEQLLLDSNTNYKDKYFYAIKAYIDLGIQVDGTLFNLLLYKLSKKVIKREKNTNKKIKQTANQKKKIKKLLLSK